MKYKLDKLDLVIGVLLVVGVALAYGIVTQIQALWQALSLGMGI
jgi:hypothetical protein